MAIYSVSPPPLNLVDLDNHIFKEIISSDRDEWMKMSNLLFNTVKDKLEMYLWRSSPMLESVCVW